MRTRWIAISWLGSVQLLTLPNGIFSLVDHLDKRYPGWSGRFGVNIASVIAYLRHPDTVELIFRVSVLAALWIIAREIKRIYRSGSSAGPDVSGWRQ